MENVRQTGTRALLKDYISKPFRRKPAKPPLDATDAEASLCVKHTKEDPSTLNVSYLQIAPDRLASNQKWYKDDLSRVKEQTVRLLYLEPGKSQDPIVGRLVCHPVQQKPRYDALSYSWGEQDDWTQITLNGIQGFAVTRTLWCALRRLRSTAVARPIWIDAICINQNNTAERNQQVAMMNSTFGNARSVLIWLGDCDDDELADCDERHLADSVLSKLEKENEDGKRAWWNRLWVVQEVALAKELMVYFGSHVLTWADFFSQLSRGHTSKVWSTSRTARAFVQSHGFARERQVCLEELLVLTGNCYASDPLDYVFGIIALVPRQDRLRADGLLPDYSLTPHELLERLSHYLRLILFHGTTLLDKLLSWTASVGHLQLTRLLLDSDQVDLATHGPIALRYAVEHGQLQVLKMLLDEFLLSADSRDRMGRTPLSWASAGAQPNAVRLLIDEYHVDPNATDEMERTPLSWVAARAQPSAWRSSYDLYPVDPSTRDEMRRNPQLLAAANRSPVVVGVDIDRILDTVRILLDKGGVDPDLEDARGCTPLAWAMCAGSEPVVRILLDTGKTDPCRRCDGQPLVAWAFEFGKFSIAKLLIARGAPDWNIKSQEDWKNFKTSGHAGPFRHDFWRDDADKVEK